MGGVKAEKQRLREHVWKKMEMEGVARFPLPIYGRIPNFAGAGKAAIRLAKLEEWRRARVVVANPDSPQRKVRELALKQGKTLVMASPRLRRGYVKIEPRDVRGKEREASSIKGAFKHGRVIGLDDVGRVDLVVTGCVAAARDGARLGKGGGYGDREIAAIRKRFGSVPVVTTLHELQLVERVPQEEHDQMLDVIVTPKSTLRVAKA
jgi:5-formyltetrahydrofolate cyclo-ligase